MHKRAILHPVIDLLSLGLLSIICISLYLLWIAPGGEKESLGSILTVATLINGAHFMASYRMLYASADQIKTYKSASIYIPLLLAIYSVFSLYRTASNPSETYWIQSILVLSSLYLALHYTGQTWGMMSSMAYVEKLSFDIKERQIFKICMKLLVFWQVIWSIYLIPELPSFLLSIENQLRTTSYIFLLVSFIAGVYAFFRFSKRIRRTPPITIFVPFITIYFWYALLSEYPTALIGVQISHALQYLIFPMRVEINRYTPESKISHMAFYLAVLLFVSALIFVIFPASMEEGYLVYSQVIVSAINIHHFYIDGCIWKISNPIVRDELFNHLKSLPCESKGI